MFQDEFGGEDVDLYDDVIVKQDDGENGNQPATQRRPSEETNGGGSYHNNSGHGHHGHIGRRHQLYVGNLTWVSNYSFTISVINIA